MLVHRVRRWPNIDPTLGGCLEFKFQIQNNLFMLQLQLIHLLLKRKKALLKAASMQACLLGISTVSMRACLLGTCISTVPIFMPS